jgi:MarR family transcriptional regulator, lower aerobic nicotinate degradation pathway regulator
MPGRKQVANRESWLHALGAADDPSHCAPLLLLYRLLKLSNLIEVPFFADDARLHHLSLNELRILMTLAPLGEAAAHEIAATAGVHPMNVSRAVASLRRSGRLRERPDTTNRRRKLLRLTPAGTALYLKLLPHVRNVATQLVADLSRRELATLSTLVDRMTARLQPN